MVGLLDINAGETVGDDVGKAVGATVGDFVGDVVGELEKESKAVLHDDVSVDDSSAQSKRGAADVPQWKIILDHMIAFLMVVL